MRTYLKLIIIVYFCLLFSGCKTDSTTNDVEQIVNEWLGRKIIFPQNVFCKSLDKDVACISPNSTPYKIVVYTDSTGCASCKLHLYKWNAIIKEANTEMAGLVNFQFYFHPKNEKEFYYLFRRDAFKYPSHIDVYNCFDKLNNFPRDNKYQTFLLDKYDNVVCIGNPSSNPRIWNLYKQIINGKDYSKLSNFEEQCQITSLEVENLELELKDLIMGNTTVSRFIVKNTGNNPLLITDINTTCGCTVPLWPKEPIPPSESAEIVVQVTPDRKGYFRKNIIVLCNIKERQFKLVIKGEVK